MLRLTDLLLGGLFSLVLVACHQEVSTPQHEQTNKLVPMELQKQPEVIFINGDETLRFDNELHLREYLQRGIHSKSLLSSSYYNVYKEIDSRIQKGIEGSYETFLNGEYRDLKKKAKAYAVFCEDEQNGALDPYPLCKAVSRDEALIANTKGIYMVGDSIRRVKLYESYKEAAKGHSQITNYYYDSSDGTSGFRANQAFGVTSNRKCQAIFDLSMGRNGEKLITLSVYSQKKVGFIAKWWIRYATTYQGRLRIDYLTQPIYFVPETDFEYRRILDKGGTTIRDVNQQTIPAGDMRSRILEFSIQRETGEYTLPFAEFKPMSDPSLEEEYGTACELKGSLDFWSRGVPYRDRGTGEIHLVWPI